MTKNIKIKINHLKSRRFLEKSCRRKNTSLRKQNCHYKKHKKHDYRFNKILANISEELASDDNKPKVVKLQFINNLNDMSNNAETLGKYKQNENYKIENRLQRMTCKIHASFQCKNYTLIAPVCSSTCNAASSNETYWKQDFRISRISRTLVKLISAKTMNFNDSCMSKRLSCNDHYKKNEGENKISIKWSQNFDKDRNSTAQHIISPLDNTLRSYVPQVNTKNILTVSGENKYISFVNKCASEEQITKRFSHKIHMFQRFVDSTSDSISWQKLQNELFNCEKIRDRRVTLHNSSWNDANNTTKYCSNMHLNKFNVKRKIGVIGCHSNTRMTRKRFEENSQGLKEINNNNAYYIMPLKCQRRVKDREKGFTLNKSFKEMPHGIENYGQLRCNKYFLRSQEYKQNSFCVPSMFVKDCFFGCYKRKNNVFNVQFIIIPKNKLYSTCTDIDIGNYKQYKAKTFSLHEIYLKKNIGSNLKANKSIKTLYNQPNTNLYSSSDTVMRNNKQYRYETPFCFEILPIEARIVHVKLKRNMNEDTGVPAPSNLSLSCHQNTVEQESCKTRKPMFLEKIMDQGHMQLKKIMGEIKRAILEKLKLSNKCVNKEKVTKKEEMCVDIKQFSEDVGFRASSSFNVDVCNPSLKQIKSLSKCDFGKHF